jgi:hypothetical protein
MEYKTDAQLEVERLHARIAAREGKPPLADAIGSAATWKRLAMQLAEESQVVLNNAHCEVSYGSGALRRTIKAAKLLQYTESEMPQNDRTQACRPPEPR